MTYREKINKLSKEEWLEAVEKSTSFSDLYRNIGTTDNGTLREIIKQQLDKFKINTSHFGILKENNKDYINRIIEACKKSTSIYNLIKNLGLRSTGSRSQEMKRIINKNKIDISHFTGRASNSFK